jgi:hypothetical protein
MSVIVSEAETRWRSLENLQNSFGLKTDIENLSSRLDSFITVTKTAFVSVMEATAMKTVLNSTKTATATKAELNSCNASAAATTAELDGLRSTYVSKTEFNSMKSGRAAKSDLDFVKGESATKEELGAVRNRLDALVVDFDRARRFSNCSFPMNGNGSLDGIITSSVTITLSLFTRRVGGNVHYRGNVTITES